MKLFSFYHCVDTRVECSLSSLRLFFFSRSVYLSFVSWVQVVVFVYYHFSEYRMCSARYFSFLSGSTWLAGCVCLLLYNQIRTESKTLNHLQLKQNNSPYFCAVAFAAAAACAYLCECVTGRRCCYRR